MNIIFITNGRRSGLLAQSLLSLKNSTDLERHTLTVVGDGLQHFNYKPQGKGTMILNCQTQGASASRNIGASSIPKYRRQEYVTFMDDDLYCCPGWDKTIEDVLNSAVRGQKQVNGLAVSGHSHPFNLPSGRFVFNRIPMMATSVLSTVQLAMPWWMWDEVGYFTEPGGPASGDDVDWCKRAADKGMGFAVTEPECIIHTGLNNSKGEPLVGKNLVDEKNKVLIDLYRLSGKVIFG